VVSEETRTISIAEGGRLERDLDVAALRKVLIARLRGGGGERVAAA
jgi:hypothetical protein